MQIVSSQETINENLLMKKTSKPNYRKLTEKVKKLDLNKATNEQLENLFHRQHIKYVMSLEDQLTRR